MDSATTPVVTTVHRESTACQHQTQPFCNSRCTKCVRCGVVTGTDPEQVTERGSCVAPRRLPVYNQKPWSELHGKHSISHSQPLTVKKVWFENGRWRLVFREVLSVYNAKDFTIVSKPDTIPPLSDAELIQQLLADYLNTDPPGSATKLALDSLRQHYQLHGTRFSIDRATRDLDRILDTIGSIRKNLIERKQRSTKTAS